MSTHEHSFRKLLPHFVIPQGTQVVLRCDRTIGEGERKPRGSVGLVIENAVPGQAPYRVRFADGATLLATAADLSIRRRELPDRLVRNDVDLHQYVIYRCRMGSHAFGLADEQSDEDLRGIYLPPTNLNWSLFRFPEQIESATATHDEVYWELEKFLRLALQANPNILEILWSPSVLHMNEIAERLRGMRSLFLTQHLYRTYSGYVLSQFRRMSNAHASTGAYRPKHAMHLVRLLYSGIEALRTGDIRIDMAEHREELLQIKGGQWTFEQAKARALELDEQFRTAFEKTNLPEEPDYERADEFLIWARRRMIDA